MKARLRVIAKCLLKTRYSRVWLISLADKAKDYERKFFLADSLEKAGVISSVRANFLRGSSLHSQNKRAASEVYYKKALDVEELDDKDVIYYSRSARTLAQMLSVKNDYETTIRIAMPAVEKLEGNEKAQSRDLAVLYYTIGSCQMYLGHDADAAQSYENAYWHYKIIGIIRTLFRRRILMVRAYDRP